MRRIRWWLLLVAMWAGTAVAAGPKALRAQLESSMVVEGTVDIAPDGRPITHALYRRDELPPGLLELLDEAIAGWRFAPLQLEPGASHGRVRMSLRLVARHLPGDQVHVSLRGARFSVRRPGESPTLASRPRGAFPKAALDEGATGIVYVALRIGSDGRVHDAAVRQVNLTALGGTHQMARWRMMLGNAAVHTARAWTFNRPTEGPDVGADEWTGLVAITYAFEGSPVPDGLAWTTYVPGPVNPVAWLPEEPDGSGDAFAGDDFQPVGTGPRLLTEVGEG